jgi:glycosyltransferase involved in cell wall biosynthesis
VLPDPGELGPALQAAGVEVLIRPVAVLRRQLLSASGLASIVRDTARNAARLRSLIAERQIALVHSNTSVVLGGAAGAALARVPHVWHVREIYSRFGPAWRGYRMLLGTASALPCVSGAAAAQFESAVRSRTRARVLYDGLAVDPDRAPRSEARAALELPSEAPVVALLGRISDWKGQDILVRALAEAPLASIGAIGVIAGDVWPGAEERRDAVIDLARSVGVADRVRLIGFRDDVENVYGAADVVAVPSTAPDPLPNSALEAAAAGCAVVASAHGGLPEIIRDRETGRLARPGDPSDLASAAAELIGDPALRERLGAAAAADVRERFAPQRLLDAIQSLYDELLR